MKYILTTALIITLLILGFFSKSFVVQAAGNACTDCLHSALSDCAGLTDAGARSQCLDGVRRSGGTCTQECSADSNGTCVYCVTNAADVCMSSSSSPSGCVDDIFSNGMCNSECKVQSSTGQNPPPGGGQSDVTGGGIDLTIQGVFNIFIGLTCWFMRVAFLLIVIAIVWSGILFAISQGDLEKFTKARQSLTYALLGALVILGVYVIIYTIANAVGVQVTFFSCSGGSTASSISSQ